MTSDNIKPDGEQTVHIDPKRFPATPPLTTTQVQRLSDAVDACERGEFIEGAELLKQLPD